MKFLQYGSPIIHCIPIIIIVTYFVFLKSNPVFVEIYPDFSALC